MDDISGTISRICKDLVLHAPDGRSIVHKSECFYSADTAASPDGIYINLKTFESFGKEMLCYDKHHDDSIYLHVKKFLVPLPPERQSESFFDEKVNETVFRAKNTYEEITQYDVLIPSIGHVPLDAVGRKVAEICNAVINHSGFEFRTDDLSWTSQIRESKYAKSLIQVEDPVQISYSNLKCNKCGAKTNLWMNLSDGYIGCGRKLYDSGGCEGGAEGAAILHYAETGGIYPLAVKIGTITSNSGDVYSYAPDEDDLVLDPFLDKHLAHFGIKIQLLAKTEKTTVQLELEKNEQHDWSDDITVGNEYVCGPKLIGLDNLGNSCYLNSVMQILVSIPELSEALVMNFKNIAKNLPDHEKAYDDVLLQFSKTCVALSTDKYISSQLSCIKKYKERCSEMKIPYVEPECYKTCSIRPSMLNYAIGKYSKQFGTGEQHDAEEFLTFFINLLHCMEGTLKGRCNTSESVLDVKSLFYFQTRQLIVCEGLKKLNYIDNETHILSLPLFQSSDLNESTYDPTVDLHLKDCLELWFKEQDIEYISEFDKTVHRAVIKNGLLEFPRYLFVHLKRFYMKSDWTAAKIDNPVIVPESGIEFELFEDQKYRDFGFSVEYTDSTSSYREPEEGGKKPVVDPASIQSLMSMGFTESISRKACERLGDVDIASYVDWILENMNDLSDEAAPPEVKKDAAIFLELGYSVQQANKAAEMFGDDVSSAVEWLSAAPELDQSDTSAPKEHSFPELPAKANIKGIYDNIGFISHIGKNANFGHYVCHIKQGDSWIKFDDSKVIKCKSSPVNQGYIYLFKRRD